MCREEYDEDDIDIDDIDLDQITQEDIEKMLAEADKMEVGFGDLVLGLGSPTRFERN